MGFHGRRFRQLDSRSVQERVQIDSVPIASEELAMVLEEIVEATGAAASTAAPPSDSLDTSSATFFELATALGFLHFARSGVDAAVVEVGLGGRFDSTNVCRPALAVITSISFDHTQILGDRLASIAMEKAGIVKPGIRPSAGSGRPRRALSLKTRAAKGGCCSGNSTSIFVTITSRDRYTMMPKSRTGARPFDLS